MQIGERIIDSDSRKRFKSVFIDDKEIDFTKNTVGWLFE
jgi:hypothetical protein